MTPYHLESRGAEEFRKEYVGKLVIATPIRHGLVEAYIKSLRKGYILPFIL